MKITETLKEKLQRLKHKASEATSSEDEEMNPEEQNEEAQGEEQDVSPESEDTSSDIDESDDLSEADRATMLRKKHIMTGLGCVGLFVAAMVGSNVLFKSAPQKQVKDPPLTSAQTSEEKASTPANGMPAKYSDITKYAEKNQKMAQGKNSNITPQKSSTTKPPASSSSRNSSSSTQERDTAPSSRPRNTSSRSSGSGNTVVASNAGVSRQQKEAERAAKEAQQAEQEALTSAIAFTQMVAGNGNGGKNAQNGAMNTATGNAVTQPAVAPAPAVASYYEQSDDTINGQYALQAGSVIQATLITGITSDMPSGDVVAQVRQNIYDSLTGEHLLIPQGSKLIGKSGSAGSRGNARIGVTFDRIILPTGESITLPSQKAIDGVGYLGMKDQYTQHTGKLFSTGIMTALIAAAAQSATGNSSGSDDRSPGQEAVAGAVTEILDTMKTVIDREGNVSPTITIRPGFEFSVFINQDLYIPEYHSDL